MAVTSEEMCVYCIVNTVFIALSINKYIHLEINVQYVKNSTQKGNITASTEKRNTWRGSPIPWILGGRVPPQQQQSPGTPHFAACPPPAETPALLPAGPGPSSFSSVSLSPPGQERPVHLSAYQRPHSNGLPRTVSP